MANKTVAVFGGGLWGAVLAQHVSQAGPMPKVRLWEFFPEAARALAASRRHPHIPGFRLDPAVEVTSDLSRASQGADVLLFALPSAALRASARALAPFLAERRPLIVNASKGVEPNTLKTMGDILAEELPHAAVYTLSGPSFAREVARGMPTKIVLAGPPGHARTLLRLLDGGALRVSLSDDRKGVELGGSLKNVLAIGAGILDGLKAGDNAKAALLVEGIDEMGRLIAAAGGKRETIYGLAGLGDLVLTGTSGESRNRSFGEKLGCGLSPERARAAIPTVVEGCEAAVSALALARRLRVRAPVIAAVHAAVRRGKPASGVLRALGLATP
ncbi:MAG: NAD(P)H-dependent glycerol-3-phosphate dehydrogenase [Elusimicrobia bacterium]|nr:NAD(P)H-dependent glycerol-3-phosphate dehydrogenase [Elusimicrobiota bacterium]MDE2425852.1 NAD(P)H-dependent glycerol-3-phosphate dehydrogenase [Elusimicrobiota bacterium]